MSRDHPSDMSGTAACSHRLDNPGQDTFGASQLLDSSWACAMRCSFLVDQFDGKDWLSDGKGFRRSAEIFELM